MDVVQSVAVRSMEVEMGVVIDHHETVTKDLVVGVAR